MSTRLLKNITLVHCLISLLTISTHAESSPEKQNQLSISLTSLKKFFETTSSIKLTSKVHQKILHSGDVTRDDHYLIQTTLSKKPLGLYRELTRENELSLKQFWNGKQKMWFFYPKNNTATSARAKGKPISPLGINLKLSLKDVDRFLPHGLDLWERLFFEKNLDKVFNKIEEHAEYIGEESIDSKPCWVIKIPYQLGNPDPPSELYATHIFSKLWIRKMDGAPIRCIFDKTASRDIWQMYNNIASDFVNIQVGIHVDHSTFDFNLTKDITLTSPTKPSLLPIGSKAPDFKITDLEGKTTSLYDYQSDMTIVSFTAPTCSNCRALYPHLQRIKDKYPDQVSILPLYCEGNRIRKLRCRFRKL